MSNVRELVRVMAEKGLGKKVFNTMMNVGTAKYVVNYHDGKSTHKDGSPFFDMRTFKSKKQMDAFTQDLFRQGYREELPQIYQ